MTTNDEIPDSSSPILEGAYRRIQYCALAFFVIGLVLSCVYETRFALGFSVGGALSMLNFVWLRESIISFLDRITGEGSKQSTAGVILRFLARFALLGLAIYYATILGSHVSVYGLMAGLSLTVLALLCEAGYEVYALWGR